MLAWLRQRRKQFGIYVFPELRIQITPTRFRKPDILVTTSKVITRVLREPPFLCIEILLPEDRANRVEPKTDEYLNFGVRHVWLIDLRERRAWLFTNKGKRETTEALSTADPSIRIPLANIFTELDEDVDLSGT